jgi:hypothetical protein
MQNKPQRLINGILILSSVPLLCSLGIFISAAAGYSWSSDLIFIIPMFLGTAIFFVGTYLEAKHEPTFGIPLYVSNRKVKMRTAISGCIMSVVMSILSLFII